MYKIAILGCENSHANAFIKFIKNNEAYSDVEILGVYSDETESANKLGEKFGLNVAKSYDEYVGKVDGIIITARHGDNHYKYAKPYISSGIPMFIDKPVTISEKDAEEFKSELAKYNVMVSGGSSLKHSSELLELKKVVSEKKHGRVCGGFFRAPMSLENDYGSFYFYSQHLVQMVNEVFGYFPKTVSAFKNDDVINCTLRYDEYDVNMQFIDKNDKYFGAISTETDFVVQEVTLDDCYAREFSEFYTILTGGEQSQNYDEFFAPIHILNAIDRSIKNNTEEQVKRP